MTKRLFNPIYYTIVFALFLSLGSLASCGATQSDSYVKYKPTAQQNFKNGEEKLKSKSWVAATKYFGFVKARFPYSQYAILADLRLADAEFGSGHYLQSIDAYKLFIRFHPTHNMVLNGYASFKIGESYYKLLPEDWWLMPPAHEKDQSAATDAHRHFTTFIRKHPKSPYLEKAKNLIIKINKRLASHEMYVAKFYWNRDKPMGTVLRLRRLLKKHAGTPLDPVALYLLGKAYIKVKMPARAKETWNQLLKQFPSHQNSKLAQPKLKSIQG